MKLNDKYNFDPDFCELTHAQSGEPGVVDMDDYQELALRTAGDHAINDPTYTAMGLNGEAGEFSEQVKHEHFHGHPADPDKKLKELGDIYWYLAAAAAKHGYKLSEIASANVVKLARRYPDKFTAEASIAREDGEELT